MVEIQDFYIGRYQTIISLWNYVARNSLNLGYDLAPRKGGGNLPVTNINYYDAVKFCNALSELSGGNVSYKLNKDNSAFKSGETDEFHLCTEATFRLPTLEEWEFACDKGEGKRFFWGDGVYTQENNPFAHQYSRVGYTVIHPVGEKKPNLFGLYDMLGNVYEWCDSIYENTDWQVIKGGSVALDSILDTKFISFVPRSFTGFETGFRIACSKKIQIYEAFFKGEESAELYIRKEKTLSDFFNLNGKTEKEFVIELFEKFKNINIHNVYKKFLSEEHFEKLMNLEHSNNKWLKDKELDFLIFNFEPAKILIEKWKQTKEKKYLDKWFALAKDYAENFKIAFDNLSSEELNINPSVPYSWAFSQGYDVSRRLRTFLSCIVEIAHCADISEIDVDALIKIIVSIMSDHLEINIKDARSTVPNQAISSAQTTIMIAYAFKDAKQAGNLMKLGVNRLESCIFDLSYLKDGGDLEQSYNYNFSLPNEYIELKNMFGKNIPQEFEKIKNSVVWRIRMLRAVSLPFGGFPATGTAYSHYPPKLYDDLKRLREYKKAYLEKRYPCFNEINDKKFNFTSIAFPYSGYYVLRDSLDVDAVYLWLMGARQGMGHMSENINNFALCAYGMNMLINAGASSYGNPNFVIPEQLKIIDQIDEYKNSSYGENLVLIDGQSQSRLKNGQNNIIKPYQDTIKARFYTGDDFDFAESFYNGSYGKDEKEIKATHNRQVIFVRKHKFFIITDIIETDGNHDYTSCLHLMPNEISVQDGTGTKWSATGFDPEDIMVSGNKILTKKKGSPNIAIYVVKEKFKITKRIGELSPCYGWLASSIVGKRHKKTDIHISYSDEGISKTVLVIAPSKDENEVISKISYENGQIKILTKTNDTIILENEVISILGENKVSLNLKNIDIPVGFNWEEGEEGIYPSYTK